MTELSKGMIRQVVARALLSEFPGRRVEVLGGDIRLFTEDQQSRAFTVSITDSARRGEDADELSHCEIVSELKTIVRDVEQAAEETRIRLTRVSAKHLRQAPAEYAWRASQNTPVVITKYGKPQAVMVSLEDAAKIYGQKFSETI